ncbi:histidine kinase [Glycomyces sp. A-F 0318]|nr:histidine kinase [Glycomyces amatae]
MAADLHDSVGHDLALIALRAGALELAPALAEPDREAAAALRASAVEATDRLRHALGTLREGAAPVTPFDEPVEALVERSVRAGMEVRLEVETEPLRPLVDRAVYRVVQEALTNAAKHAAGTAVTVRIRQRGDVVRMAVVNAGGKVPTGTGLRWESSTAPTGSAPMKADAVWAGRTGTESAGSGPAAGPLRERLPGESVPSGSGPAAPVDSGRRELEGPPRASVSGGAGLAGLAERVRLLGGTFTAGPRGGGFAVEAELPVRGDA